MDKDRGMPSYPDKYFDLAIVDPPYDNDVYNLDRIHRLNGSKKSILKAKLATPKNYDFNTVSAKPDEKYFIELKRTSKNQIIWGVNWYPWYLGPGRIIWDKETSGYFSDCELAYQSFNRSVIKFKYRWNGMLQENMKNKEERIHPTQKPIALYKWLLSKYAKPNDKILDTHVGSASSLIACEEMGFEYTGFELDSDYFNAANKRLEQFRSQLKLAI